MRRGFESWSLALTVAAIGLAGCRTEQSAEKTSPQTATTMADSLKALAALARQNPTQNVFLNRARALSIMEEATLCSGILRSQAPPR